MSVVCEICTEKQAKYKCPACSRQTCSLECVRRHKVDTSCTGKRPRTEKVAMKDFKDSILIKDFELLEDSKGSLHRCRPSARPDVLRKRDLLKSECYQRGIHLRLMPHLFSLAKSNSSTVRNRKDTESGKTSTEILWKLDWVFEGMDTVLSDTCVSETSIVKDLINRFMDDSWKLGPTRDKLIAHDCPIDTDKICVFLQNHQQNEIPIDITQTVSQVLATHAILEYPTFRIKHSLS